MRGWIFLLIGAGLLLLAPDHASRGGVLEHNPDAIIWIVGGMVALALLIRPAEEHWTETAGDSLYHGGYGCGIAILQLIGVLLLMTLALWLLAGAPEAGRF